MVASHLVWMLKESAVILRAAGMEALAEKYLAAAREVTEATNRFLWMASGTYEARGTTARCSAVRRTLKARST